MSLACPFEFPIGNSSTFLLTRAPPVSLSGTRVESNQDDLPLVSSASELWGESLLLHPAVILERPSEDGEILSLLSHVAQVLRSKGFICTTHSVRVMSDLDQGDPTGSSGGGRHPRLGLASTRDTHILGLADLRSLTETISSSIG